MLNSLDIKYCNNIRMYGEFISRYDMNENGTKNYDETRSILVYKYEGTIYYLIMEKGQFIDYLW